MPTSPSYRLWMGVGSRKTSVGFVHIGNRFVKEIQLKDTPSSEVGLNFLRVLVKLATNLQISLDSCPHPVDVQKKCVVSIERIQLIKCHSKVS